MFTREELHILEHALVNHWQYWGDKVVYDRDVPENVKDSQKVIYEDSYSLYRKVRELIESNPNHNKEIDKEWDYRNGRY
jgi:hypothetical protein